MTVFDTFKHSSAPFVAGQEYDYKRNEINSADGRCVAVVWVRKAHDGICAPRSLFKDDPEGMANWRLLTAAPELLEALTECLTSDNAQAIVTNDVAYLIRRLKAINKIAQAAIDRATK